MHHRTVLRGHQAGFVRKIVGIRRNHSFGKAVFFHENAGIFPLKGIGRQFGDSQKHGIGGAVEFHEKPPEKNY